MSLPNNLLHKILRELSEIRQDIVAIQRTLVRMEASSQHSSSTPRFHPHRRRSASRACQTVDNITANNIGRTEVYTTKDNIKKTSEMRKVLNKAWDIPVNRICRDHQHFGKAADQRNCTNWCKFRNEQLTNENKKKKSSTEPIVETIVEQTSQLPIDPAMELENELLDVSN